MTFSRSCSRTSLKKPGNEMSYSSYLPRRSHEMRPATPSERRGRASRMSLLFITFITFLQIRKIMAPSPADPAISKMTPQKTPIFHQICTNCAQPPFPLPSPAISPQKHPNFTTFTLFRPNTLFRPPHPAICVKNPILRPSGGNV